MIAYIDVFNNSIVLLNTSGVVLTKEFTYSLSIFENKIKAIEELQQDNTFGAIKKDKKNILILPDDLIGYGTFKLPNVKKKNEKDIFLTQFRLAFPNYLDYFVSSQELSRNDENVTYSYAFCKIAYINKITDAFDKAGLPITTKATLNESLLGLKAANNEFPQAFLYLGKNNSELFIAKGNKVIANNIFGFGEEILNTFDKYLYSVYNYDNNEALCFSSFIKGSLSSNKDVPEEEILTSDPANGLRVIEPKQIRILKDNSLKQFYIKNNYLKFSARIFDILAFYKLNPWFIPINNINIISSKEVYDNMMSVNKDRKEPKFTNIDFDISKLNSIKLNDNSLFSSGMKKERRKIDWKAFFNMEIGRRRA